ncbi:DUF3857 domain-containing protein [Zunongwangia endophytica]|uniref:DUF3857 domain-containing protein n=1 Tax=Zunongwangia endophytica TaxID=1808945 RepID=A0ABV8H823_9FLAO|nr:DUF3857 domain-containing protein [Zunongwangia endophytica]MDN3595135.1 DUF3857 domain-containing protein [Zunongwangia endophytica]
MNKLLLPLLLIFSTSLFAQEADSLFNKQNFNVDNIRVTKEDLAATIYLPDTTANAFYIFENGFSRIDDDSDFHLFTDYEAKIKILNKEGYDEASIVIPLYKGSSKSEKIHDLKAFTSYLDGSSIRSTALSQSKIFTEEDEKYDYIKFTFPDVQPGAVLVYSYTKETPYTFNFNTWWFQKEIPKAYSRYRTEIPANYDYNIIKRGELQLDQNDAEVKKKCFYAGQSQNAGDCIVTTYAMKEIPAFIEEEYLTSKYNYISRIEYELKQITMLDGYERKYTKEWKDVDKEFRTDKNIGRQLRKDRLVNELLPAEIASQDNNLDKAKAIYNFVRDHYKWNEEYGLFDKMNLKDLLEDHTGNVSSLNVLLHNFYNNEGYKVYPVISATRNQGFPKKIIPVLSDFNYLFVLLDNDGKEYMLDATDEFLEFGQLPFRALNQYGRKLDFDNESSWIDINPEGYSQIAYRDSLIVNKDGSSITKSKQNLVGYHASAARKKIERDTDKENLLKALNTVRDSYDLIDLTYEGEEDTDENLSLTYEIKNPSQKVGNKVYLNPFTFLFWKENPFKLEKRKYPIDFGYKDVYSSSILIKIPANLDIKEIPSQQVIGIPNNAAKIQFTAQKIDTENIFVNLRVVFSQAMYASEYYPYLKEFMDKLVTIQTQSIIVLQEKNI